jgi:hypothetical protein
MVIIKKEKEGKVTEIKVPENRVYVSIVTKINGKNEKLLYKLVPGISPLLGHTFYELVEPLGVPNHTEMNSREENLTSVYPQNDYGIKSITNLKELRSKMQFQLEMLNKQE